MTDNNKNGAFGRAVRRIAAVAVISAAALSLAAGSAQARPPDIWYPCTIDGKPMWCMDVT
ncbi:MULTISPECIES: hypothetical protein [Nonomuraea]|jgi:hypothetical protein|uniref:Uncharacterized protein n=1 Tax=Nonomuraea ferruginea TaxID=46174 RepID=A0ABT4SV68_9ACTN|nr:MULTISPECIES: hypothetical protein [Nonomuraea]MDA0641161.1 hypothetical protein [Nonomuraea ferruginea]TXK34016.1 hypothetical protein FR742_31900 [Nonomuraea sp. C10]